MCLQLCPLRLDPLFGCMSASLSSHCVGCSSSPLFFSLFLLSGAGEMQTSPVCISPSDSSSWPRTTSSTRTSSTSFSPRFPPRVCLTVCLGAWSVSSPLFSSSRFRFRREKDQANRRTRHDNFSGANVFSLVQARRCRFSSLLFYSFVTLSPRSLVFWLFLLAICGVPSSDL